MPNIVIESSVILEKGMASLDQMEPLVNPESQSDKQDLPKDVMKQIKGDEIEMKILKEKDYKMLLEKRYIGFKVEEKEQATPFKNHGTKADEVVKMKVVNDAMKFKAPKCPVTIEKCVYDYYERNINLKVIEGDEIP